MNNQTNVYQRFLQLEKYCHFNIKTKCVRYDFFIKRSAQMDVQPRSILSVPRVEDNFPINVFWRRKVLLLVKVNPWLSYIMVHAQVRIIQVIKIYIHLFFFFAYYHTLYTLSYESQKENAALDSYCILHSVPESNLFLLFHRLFYRCYRPWISVKCHIAPFCE